MQRWFLFLFFVLSLFCTACHEKDVAQKNSRNPGYNQLRSTFELEETGQIQFSLDSLSAPKVEYTQLFRDPSGKEILSFFNKHNQSIYFYDYPHQSLLRTVKIGPDLPVNDRIDPTGYYVDNEDTIYVYNRRNIEMLRINKYGNILRKISLIANNNIRQSQWFLKFPQYYPQGSNPIMKIAGKLVFTGQSFEALKDTLIRDFHFAAYIDEKTNDVQFFHEYPDSLYGHNYNWSGEKFTEVYIDWNPESQYLVFSFPVSHQLYLAEPGNKSYMVRNGASNFSSTISSFPASIREMKIGELVRHVLQSDEYGPIRYDAYRKVYYRFIRHGIKNYTSSSQWNDKEISVIILNKDFNYLGETNIGRLKNWYIQNAFVNEKGLHIEYIPNVLDEDFLTYKIFNLINKK